MNHELGQRLFACGVSAMFLLSACSKTESPVVQKPATTTATSKTGGENLSVADSTKTGEQTKPPPSRVLDPTQYIGKVRLGYAAAQAVPQVCAKLFCYCGCDYTDEHNSLLDCFTCVHGVDCNVCQDESILAMKLTRQGKSVAEVQKAIDGKFGRLYPFCLGEIGRSELDASDKLKKYWTTRLWKPSKEEDDYIKGKTMMMPRSLYEVVESVGGKAQAHAGNEGRGCCGKKVRPQDG